MQIVAFQKEHNLVSLFFPLSLSQIFVILKKTYYLIIILKNCTVYKLSKIVIFFHFIYCRKLWFSKHIPTVLLCSIKISHWIVNKVFFSKVKIFSKWMCNNIVCLFFPFNLFQTFVILKTYIYTLLILKELHCMQI